MKIAIIYDVDGWAYHERAMALQKYSPSDCDVHLMRSSEVTLGATAGFDLIFNLDYASSLTGRVPPWVPVVTSFNCGKERRREMVSKIACSSEFIIFNNKETFDSLGRPERSCCISNGVDVGYWTGEIGPRPERVIWCGSTGKGKNYHESLVPLIEKAKKYGFECDFHPVSGPSDESILPRYAQREWYRTAKYVVCASESEGTPNYLHEAVSCGCLAVSPAVGNIAEWGESGVNCIITESNSTESLLEGLLDAREAYESISWLGQQTIRQKWGYGSPGDRAMYYFSLFRSLIEKKIPKPFSYDEINWREIG